MEKISIVGINGKLLGEPVAGYLLPILMTEGGIYFQDGHMPNSDGFDGDLFKKGLEEKAIIKIENPFDIRSAIPDYVPRQSRGVEALSSDARVFYFSKDIRELMENHDSLSKGVLCQTSYEGYEFRFHSSKDLKKSIFSSLTLEAERRIRGGLRQRFVEGDIRDLFIEEGEPIERLAQFMREISYNDKTEQNSIDYRGLVALLGSCKDNYEAWLDIAIRGSSLPVSPEKHKQRSFKLMSEILGN